MLGSDAEANDVVSDVFTSLYERPQQYQGRSALSTFLYGMTTHACLSRIRNRNRRSRLLRYVSDAPASGTQPLAPDRAIQLRTLLDRVPEPLGLVAVYYYLDELTHEEIAEILGCSRRHVGNLLARLSDFAERGEQR
jgi:RNA polymerase sigma-70 factor (ECF subfamily)